MVSTVQQTPSSGVSENQQFSISKRKKLGHTRPRQPEISLDQPGRLRVANLLAIFNVSHSTLYAGVKRGRYPSPDGWDGNFPFWKTSTIKKFLDA